MVQCNGKQKGMNDLQMIYEKKPLAILMILIPLSSSYITLWEGSFFPRLPDGKRKKFNVYAKTREECEKLLAEMIEKKKTEIAEMKKKAKKA